MTNYPGDMNSPGGYHPAGGGSPSFDLRTITPGGLIVLAGSLLYFVFSFMPWYTIDLCGGFKMPEGYGITCSASANAWDRGVATFSVIVFLLVAIMFVVKAFRVVPPKVPLEISALGVVLIGDILFLVSFFDTQGTSRGWGMWVALAMWLAINVGAVLEVVEVLGIGSAQRGAGIAGQQGYPPPGYPQQGYPPPGYPQQGYPQQGYPPQSYPPQGGNPPYPPQGPPPPPPPPPGQGGYPPQNA